MSRKIVFVLMLIPFLLTVSCTKETSIDIGDALGKAEDTFRQLDGIATTASSFDGKKDVKFRLMVEKGTLTEAEAIVQYSTTAAGLMLSCRFSLK
ncbi:hypothetical protein [Paenibacillus mendelii]|uniref:Uncharacterized protein n=1 Tax=Paenibacillus mendelii TaxID=206163 RepID=A0ABV6JLJ3_9BACL|nr:hypothetical protein [Paenibacillus mendelii]MCQ6563997.1 hypothetical protein [Paenibacillus mendelii]